MSNFPNKIDDDKSLPSVIDNITETGAESINSAIDAIFKIEEELGINASGSSGSISQRISKVILPNGDLNPSVLSGLGLITLPITNIQISDSAGITENKLKLDHKTQDLYNNISYTSSNVDSILKWINASGSKLDPHLSGVIYNHELFQINVSSNTDNYLKNKFSANRDNSNSYTVLKDLNDDFVSHQTMDGLGEEGDSVYTQNGDSFPSNFSHLASSIYLDSARFANVPQTTKNVQEFAEFIDESSATLNGARLQNLYSNGISRTSRSSSLLNDGYGSELISSTKATAYLLVDGISSTPIDDIDHGDDVIELFPTSQQTSTYKFDSLFSLVMPGDILRVNYGAIEVSFLIKEKKFLFGESNSRYFVRIDGKNLFYTTNASVRIDKTLVNSNKHAVLFASGVNNSFSEYPSLIINQPRVAQTLGIGFNPDQLDADHYLLYLGFMPDGNPSNFVILPPIDVTGNRGTTPGNYSLSSVIEATNNAIHRPGYNYRFVAFNKDGEFGIALSDCYNNASFTIISGNVDENGFYDQASTLTEFPKNVVDVFPITGGGYLDPLGFGPSGSNIASPPYTQTYPSVESALFPTKILSCLRRNNFYVNGIEKEKLTIQENQILDAYGDGYWIAKITNKQVYPGVNGRTEVTYTVNFDLSTTNLFPGKTIVVQPLAVGTINNFGRFIIKSLNIDCSSSSTTITVYDGVHSTGNPSSTIADIGTEVALYYSGDSVGFSKENLSDAISVGSSFKRLFEVFVDEGGKSFSHERARLNATTSTIQVNDVDLYGYSELAKLDLIYCSPKLTGYQFGNLSKITLFVSSYDDTSGVIDGYLCNYNGSNATRIGPLTSGRIGEVLRFYDDSNVDFVDVKLPLTSNALSFTNRFVDIQLFKSLERNQQLFFVCNCQVNDLTKSVNNIVDKRSFGNTSEDNLTTSALNYISAPERLLHSNGVVKGFDVVNNAPYTNPIGNQYKLTGGTLLCNGNILNINASTITIPLVKETFSSVLYDINWLLCVNSKSEYELIVLLNADNSYNVPTDETRIPKLYNPNNGRSYDTEGLLFSDLLNKRKDLTLLYIVSSSVDANTLDITTSITDARKFVNDVDSNLPLRLTSVGSQGNFKTPESIFNWIKYNNQFNGTAFVRGATLTSGVVNQDIIFDFSNSVVIDGQNNSIITFNGNFGLGSNVTFKNMTIRLRGGVNVESGATNVSFENCTINYVAPASTIPANNTVFDFSAASKVSFLNCNISGTYSTLESGGSLMNFATSSNISLENCTISVTFSISAGTYTPGDVLSFSNVSNLKIVSSTITGNFANGISLSNSISNVSIDDVTLSVIGYNPLTGPDFGFSSANLINSGHGLIYILAGTAPIRDVLIKNIDVNYTSISRFSHINIEMSSVNSLIENMEISNCRFNYNSTSTTVNDYSASIAILNTIGTSIAGFPKQPTLRNVVIRNNFMNRLQSIVITSTTVDQTSMFSPGLVCENCEVVDNTCGAIGYFVSSANKYYSIETQVSSNTDKTSSLLISNNNCHYIYNCNENGKYYLISKVVSGATVDRINYQTGNVSILNNKTSWIHTSIGYEENSTLIISKNILTGYNPEILSNYGTDTNYIDGPSSYLNSTKYAIFVNGRGHILPSVGTPGSGANSQCIISENITESGYWINAASVQEVYQYLGYVMSQVSCNIVNNIFKGIDNTTDQDGYVLGIAVLVGGPVSIVTNNKIYRNNNPIRAYVGFLNTDLPASDGEYSYGIVTDNYFDSPITYGSSETTVLVPSLDNSSWLVERNINQTGYVNVSFTNGNYYGLHTSATDGYLSRTSDTLYVDGGNTSVSKYRSHFLRIKDAATSASRYLGFQQDIDKAMPYGSRLLEVKMAIRTFNSTVETTTNPPGGFDSFFKMTLNKHAVIDNPLTSLDAFSNFDDDDPNVTNDASPLTYLLTGSLMNSSSQALQLYLDSSSTSEEYIAGKYAFSISLEGQFKTFGTTGEIMLSPLVVKYRW